MWPEKAWMVSQSQQKAFMQVQRERVIPQIPCSGVSAQSTCWQGRIRVSRVALDEAFWPDAVLSAGSIAGALKPEDTSKQFRVRLDPNTRCNDLKGPRILLHKSSIATHRQAVDCM